MKKFWFVFLLPLGVIAADIYMAGDSTMCKYLEKIAPRAGWGMAMQRKCKPGTTVFNHAGGGHSTMSFMTSKRWEQIRKTAKKGDFIIIQFGHNDAHRGQKNLYRSTFPENTYKMYLRLYVQEARNIGMIPVLCTQTALWRFRDGKVYNLPLAEAYIKSCREVAKEMNCDLIDINAAALEKLTALGPDAAAKIFMILKPGEHKNYPEGKKDIIHLSETGADFYAQIFVGLAKKQNLAIAQLFQ